MTETMKTLKRLFDKSGYSQALLAKRCNKTEASISQWLNGTRTPSIENVEILAEALGYKLYVLR